MKRFSVLILTIAFIFTVFAACAKSNEEETTIQASSDIYTEQTYEAAADEKNPTADAATQENTTTAEATTTAKATTTTEATTTQAASDTSEAKTEAIQESTTEARDDLSMLGSDYSPARAGLVYNNSQQLSVYDSIEEGQYYYEYDHNGHCYYKQKPYSHKNEHDHKNDHKNEHNYEICNDCGKYIKPHNGKHYGCYYGYCSKWDKDINCPECNEFLKAGTCHICKR